MCELMEGANYEKIPFPEDRKAIDVGDFMSATTKLSKKPSGGSPKLDFEEGISASQFEYFRDEEHYLMNI